MYISLLVIAITLLLIISVRNKRKYYHSLPPGPPAIPILGSFPFLKGTGFFDKLSGASCEKYGKDFVTVWIGNRLGILIQDFNICRSLFAKDEFSSRPTGWFFKVSIQETI